ncbi:MAG: hypothetical protein Q4B17_07585 [Lautropia sp.]|nr:hypothetical protein [Lautropia sp.]
MQRRQFIQSAAGSLMAMAGSGAWAAADPPAAQAGEKPLYAPTRYAYVADRISPFIAIVDIVSGEYIDSLYIGMRPQILEVARDDAMLAAAAQEVAGIYFCNLKTRETRMLKLPSPVYQIFFLPQTRLVAVGLRDQVGLINYEDFSVKLFSRRFDSLNRKTPLNTFYSLLFSSFSRTFWVLDEEKPVIYRNQGDADPDSSWEEIDLSGRVMTKSGLGIGVASPEDHLLAMTTDDGIEGLLYFPEEGRLVSTGRMRTVGTTNEPMLMPYVDAYSRRVIFADVEGHVALFDLDKDREKAQRFHVNFSPRVIRTGWLESTWILGGDKGLLFQSFDEPEDRKLYRFPAEVLNVWVTGDSKTALVSIDEQRAQLFRYDIRTREMMEPIRVRNMTMASLIRMGSNNSICY